MAPSFFSALLRLFGAWIIYVILRTIYRLTYHPLAKFPGPRLAAITIMYAGSYDLPSGTSFCKKLPELHDKYGPIVRIRPNEIHVRDMEAYNQVYRIGTPFKKDPELYSSHIVAGSFFNIHDTKEAKLVKDMYQPYFSRAAIQRLEGSIHEKVTKFLKALEDAAKSSKVVDLTLGYKCLTADIVMGYCYQKTFGALDAPDFQFQLLLDLEELFRGSPLAWYFPGLVDGLSRLLAAAPRSFIDLFMKPMGATFEIQNGCKERITALQAEPINSITPTVFQTALHPITEKGQRKPDLKALCADALLFFAAGTDTTAHTLTTGTWHLLHNPEMVEILRKELLDVIPEVDLAAMANWMTLERLPYLCSVVKESLRLSMGVPGRIPRVVPPGGAIFCGLEIPPGEVKQTLVSQTAYAYHMSEQYFTDATSFKPERWLGPDSVKLEKTLLSFSRGSRGCLGINLAYAELFTAFAYVFRKFDLEVRDTTDRDMDWKDCYTPATYGHLKVSVKET